MTFGAALSVEPQNHVIDVVVGNLSGDAEVHGGTLAFCVAESTSVGFGTPQKEGENYNSYSGP